MTDHTSHDFDDTVLIVTLTDGTQLELDEFLAEYGCEQALKMLGISKDSALYGLLEEYAWVCREYSRSQVRLFNCEQEMKRRNIPVANEDEGLQGQDLDDDLDHLQADSPFLH